MKTKTKILIGVGVLIVGLALAGNTKENQITYTAGEIIKSRLKDPDSYQLDRLEKGQNEGDVEVYTLYYRAKNSFGGYVTGEAVVRYYPSSKKVGVTPCD